MVTKSAVRYYKSQEASLTHPAKPLLVVPMLALETVSRVNVNIGLNKEQTLINADFLVNQFELNFRDDFLPIYLRQGYEKEMQKQS